MSEVQRILEANTRFRIETEVPSPEDISTLQEIIGKELPPCYVEFLELHGLDDPRFTYEILQPSAIRDQLDYVTHHGFVPFASNGCGDLACWSLSELPSCASYLWDHETDTYTKLLSTFEEALILWRA